MSLWSQPFEHLRTNMMPTISRYETAANQTAVSIRLELQNDDEHTPSQV